MPLSQKDKNLAEDEYRSLQYLGKYWIDSETNFIKSIEFLKEYNAISIEKIVIKKPVIVENAIITSQNSANILINLNAELHNVFCVGSKTAALLDRNKYNIIKSSNNAVSLANFIVENYSNDLFVFFCGFF